MNDKISIYKIMSLMPEMPFEKEKEIHDGITELIRQEKKAMADSIISRIDGLTE